MNLQTIVQFPSNFYVLERGWLSSNTIVVTGPLGAAVVDTGYVTHAAQTVGLIQSTLVAAQVSSLGVCTVVNTHLHSDHCGGNASVTRRWPTAKTWIPPGHAAQVRDWDVQSLTFAPTGQQCERFGFDATLVSGSSIVLGGESFDVHAAPGHDPHSVVLFHPASRGLISADALWQNGFGVVFPTLEGIDAFDEVGASLDLIETLAPSYVIPGHGAVFVDIGDALGRARGRLAYFQANPDKHAVHAIKVLIKFKMLEMQVMLHSQLIEWVEATPYFGQTRAIYAPEQSLAAWAAKAVQSLVAGGALRLDGNDVHNFDP